MRRSATRRATTATVGAANMGPNLDRATRFQDMRFTVEPMQHPRFRDLDCWALRMRQGEDGTRWLIALLTERGVEMVDGLVDLSAARIPIDCDTSHGNVTVAARGPLPFLETGVHQEGREPPPVLRSTEAEYHRGYCAGFDAAQEREEDDSSYDQGWSDGYADREREEDGMVDRMQDQIDSLMTQIEEVEREHEEALGRAYDDGREEARTELWDEIYRLVRAELEPSG